MGEPDAGQGTLMGWRNCTTDDCGRNSASAYSTFVFVRLDDRPVHSLPLVTVAPGHHWIEARYSWGVGFLLGVGNFRNYGFELDVRPGHRYAIREAPAGCLVPASRHWVSPKVLRVEERAPTGALVVHEIAAMEYCAPAGSGSGTCTKDADCESGTCTPFGGSTGYGLCGVLRK